VSNVEFIPSRRQVLAGGAGLSLLAFLTACGAQGSSTGGASGAADQLIVAWPNDADSLDPQNSSYSFQDWDLNCNLYETLVSPKFIPNGQGVMVWDGLSLAPELAAGVRSTAILDALPHPEGSVDTPLIAIAGAPPSPGSIPSGCAFHPRCAYTQESCVQHVPPLVRSGDRLLACPIDPLVER